MYEVVRKTFHEDVDHLAQLFAELEPMSLDDYEAEDEESVYAVGPSVVLVASVCNRLICLFHQTAAEQSIPDISLAVPEQPIQHQYDPLPRPYRKRRKSDPVRSISRILRPFHSYPYLQELDDALVISSTDPSIPTIVVTPCATVPRDCSCLVPYQDVSFGNKLAVPMYPVVNGVFPPLLPKPVPYVDKWCFRDGHWWAVLPPLEEQMKRNMFSRPVSRRRRIPHGDGWLRSLRTHPPPHSHISHRHA